MNHSKRENGFREEIFKEIISKNFKKMKDKKDSISKISWSTKWNKYGKTKTSTHYSEI